MPALRPDAIVRSVCSNPRDNRRYGPHRAWRCGTHIRLGAHESSLSERFRAPQQNASVHADGIPVLRSVSGELAEIAERKGVGFISTTRRPLQS